MSYFSLQRIEMVDQIQQAPGKVLDLGCSEGGFLEAVKARFPEAQTTGLEIDPAAAEVARQRADRVFNASIMEAPRLLTAEKGTFDVISMNDVLEHVVETDEVLTIVKGLLAPTGTLLLSIPNIRYYLTVRDLAFKGQWEYTDFGILDRTHLRFFTKKSIVKRLQDNAFDVQSIEGINKGHVSTHYRILFGLLPGSFADMLFPQFAVRAQLPSA